MPYTAKNFIIELRYPLELPEGMANTRQRNCKHTANWIEALAALNRELRLYNSKNNSLTIDYLTGPNHTLLAKRYSDAALLEYTKNGKTWQLLSRSHYNLSENVHALAIYMQHLRKAEALRVIPLVRNCQDPIAIKDPGIFQQEEENDIFERITKTKFQ